MQKEKNMFRVVLMCMLFGVLISFDGQSQSSVKQVVSGYSWYHPSKDKESWQRLNLLLSSTYIVVAKEGLVDHDTCLYTASRSLGLSRFPVLAEGFGDGALFAQSQWIDRREAGVGMQQLAKATGRKRLELLLLLGSYYAFQPGNYSRYRDSVDYFLSTAIAESRSLKEERLGRIGLCLLGKMYVQVNHPKGDSIYNLLIDQCRKAGDKATEARAFAYRGMYTAPIQATFQGKVTDLQTASGLYHSLGNTEGEINALTDLGYMLVVSGQMEAANRIFLQAIRLEESIHYPYIHYNSDAIAMVTSFQGQFGEPLRYALQTIKVAESSRDSIGWAHFYSRLSGLYALEGREDKERYDLTQKALDRFVVDRDPAGYGVLNDIVAYMCGQGRSQEALDLAMAISKKVNAPSNLADQFRYFNVLATCYTFLGKLDLAELYIKKMDSLETVAEGIRGPFLRGTVNDQFAHLYLKQGQYGKAKAYFEKLIATPLMINQELSSKLYAYHWLIHIDSIMGDHVSMTSHYRKYKALLDSNFKVTKIRQAEELKVLYETQEKEDQITLLNEQATLEKANLEQARLVKNLTLAGIAAVLIIAGLLYRQSHLRRKNNKVVTQKNVQLEQLLTDKEWLLKEIHHRVKNNLQMVMSLLNSQAVYINNDAAFTAIQDSKRRVYAMSLIHQKLYQSENIASIAMAEYINELVNHAQDSLGTRNRIVFEQDIERLDLDVSQAVPLGLIINECIVNAIKYAFPHERKGVVRITLQHDGADQLLLNISDNGIGLPVDVDLIEHSSLGLELVQGLARQLKGRFNMVNNNGLHITIRFALISQQMTDETLANF
jgi:two-component sensor histidine kinase